jgi:hypothetical protein
VSRQGRRLNHRRQVGGIGGVEAGSHEEGDGHEFNQEEDEDDRRWKMVGVTRSPYGVT